LKARHFNDVTNEANVTSPAIKVLKLNIVCLIHLILRTKQLGIRLIPHNLLL